MPCVKLVGQSEEVLAAVQVATGYQNLAGISAREFVEVSDIVPAGAHG